MMELGPNQLIALGVEPYEDEEEMLYAVLKIGDVKFSNAIWGSEEEPLRHAVERVNKIREALDRLLDESTARTRRECANYGESYGKGTDAEQFARSVLEEFTNPANPSPR